MKISYSQLLIWVAWLVSNRAFNCCGSESGDGVVCGHRRWGMVWQQGWRLGAHHYGARAIHNDCALQRQHKDISKSIHPSWRHGFKFVCRPGLVELVSAMKSKTNPGIRMVQIPISVIILYCALHYHYAISIRWSCCKWWAAGSNHEQKPCANTFQDKNLNFPTQPCADGCGNMSTSFESLLFPFVHTDWTKQELYHHVPTDILARCWISSQAISADMLIVCGSIVFRWMESHARIHGYWMVPWQR